MAKLPGEAIVIEGAWSPEGEDAQRKRRTYKEDMAKPEAGENPFSQFLQDATPATRIEETKTGLWDRFKGHFTAAQGYGSPGIDELGKIRDEQLQRDILPDGSGGVYQQTPEDATRDAEFLAEKRAERQFAFDAMDPAETPMDYFAAIGGELAGAVVDPMSVLGPEAKIGTTAWRMKSPVVSKVLDYGVSNAAMNAALNATVQAEEGAAGLRDEIDWQSILVDAGAGFAFGVPFGAYAGRAARAEQAQLASIVAGPAPGTAPMAPRGPRVEVSPEQTTVESLSSKHSPDAITMAQETLFGEAVGTRNLTPEQLIQVEDYLNAGTPFGEQDLPEVRDTSQPEAQPVSQVRGGGQPQDGAGASPDQGGPAPLAGGYQNFRPDDLKVDAKRFQYKGGADEEGVVETLKKVKKWDPNKAGTIVVWQDLQGNNFVVDGHQRYGLAKRLQDQDPTLHALVWKEADGISADDARIMAADINISQGSGSAIDAAKILRARPEMLENLPKNMVTEHGVGLSKLSDDAFGMVVNGAVQPEYAAIVGRIAPNLETHAQIMDVLAKNEPANAAQAESMVRDVLQAPEVEATMVDMFGSAEVTQILFKERAQVLSSAATLLRKDRAAFNTLVKEEARLTGAGNKLATKTNIERATTDAEILATLQATARRKGPVADALAAAAKALHDGTPRQVAVRDFLNSVRGPAKGAEADGEGIPAPALAASLGGYRNTDTPAFKRWFGDSKVVDGEGNPLMLHHGTVAEFEAFRESGAGLHFGTEDQAAHRISDKSAKMPTGDFEKLPTMKGGMRGFMLQVYLKMENPKRVQDQQTAGRWKLEVDQAKAEGHDGLIYKNRFEGRTWADSYVVFSPTQVKSIFNRGTWDPEDPRIAFSVKQSGPGLFDVGADAKPRITTQNIEAYRGKVDVSELAAQNANRAKAFEGGQDVPLSKIISTKDESMDPVFRAGGKDGRARAAGYMLEVLRGEKKARPPITVYANDDGTFTVIDGNNTAQAAMLAKWSSIPVEVKSKPVNVERGADGKPQSILPGAERITDKTLAERRADAPLKAKANQKNMDFGLFGDGGSQLDLVDMSRGIARMSREETDYLDFTPTGKAQSATIGKASVTYAVHPGEVEIISFRVPTEMRKQGEGREAMMAFLDRADDEGLAVRAYSTPLDRSMDPEGIVRFYEQLGFTATGRKIDRQGNIEMLRSGPPPEVQELRSLVGSGRVIPMRDYTDPAMAQQVRSAYYGAQPERTLDELYDGILQKRQDELDKAGKELAAEVGAKFQSPGIKKLETAQEKIVRKRYKSTKQLTDLVRAGFLVEHPDDAQRIINMLARKFQVLDEGWNITPENYFDKKVSVRFTDGTIGEVQFWNPDLLEAKKAGHELYIQARSLPPGPEKAALEQAQRDLYSAVLEGLDPSWAATVGRGGKVPNIPENISRKSSSESTMKPDSPTSLELTSSQAPPGSSTAQANPPSRIAGRPSQSTKSMGSSSSPQGIAFDRRPQPLSNVPVNRSQAGVPALPKAPKVERLEDVSEALRAITGAPVRQGRLARAPKGQKVAGQYDRDQGVIRMREAADFETQAHETAHSLETEWGRTLHALKNTHKAELEQLAYPGADQKQLLSEGFAEWFRFFVTTPLYARKVAPGFTNDFVNMLNTEAREQLDAIRDVQARYGAWTMAPSAGAVAGDIVTQKKGNPISEAVAEAGGPREAMGEFLSKTYTTLIDKLHPINRAVDELMKVYEKRTGQALNIKSAEDPYRLARLLGDAYSAGHVDAMHGVVPYQGVVSEGPSLSDAITTALGSEWRGWDDTAMADFAAYLVSRRSLQEYDRFLAGEIPNPPGKFTRGDYEVTVQELETAHPNYVQAAEMVYEWGRNMLRKKYESGFLTQKLYDELLQRKDYVPLMRDLRDLDKVGGATPNMTLRDSVMKAFKGSKRSVINPLESMLADSYHFNALMKRNEVFRTLEDLAKTAGPGGGAIVERIPSTQLKGTKVGVDEVLRSAAKDAGLSPDDVDHLTTLIDDLLGDDANATVFRAGEISEKGEPIIYAWRNGKKQALRLADGDFGRDLYNAMTGMNKEARNAFVSVLSLPSTIVRYGVTTAPHFVLANYIRDQMSAWVLAGDGYIPFISGAMGLRDELTQREVTRIYNTFGGIMGGGNVASLDKGRAVRDINALNKKGYQVKRFVNIRGLAEFTGLTETGTRLGIFKNSFARAKKGDLTDYEAAVEAAYQARDYFDLGRHGSQTHAARRLVTFLNASVQGLEKTVRVLSGEGAIRKAIAPYINHKAGRPLGARDKENLARAATAWAKMTAIGMFGLGLSYLYRDDPEYEEISDYLKATHWMVKKGAGEWYAIPKPFELGFVSNLFERGFESVYKKNPIAMESFYAGLYENTAPPMGIPLFETTSELRHNRDALGREIVGQDIAGFEPWRQYTAQTSEIAKALGAAVNVSPAKIDHAIQGFGASWGKIITDASTARQQGKNEVDILAGSMANRFIRDVTRGATSTRQFWGLMSESNGPMMQAANTYKDQFESAGALAADQVLATKDDNTKALALMLTHFKPDVERLNPMIRAKDSISVISKVRRELASNDLKSIEDDETPITLTPSNRAMVQDFLSKITMIEARNALVVMGVPGWKQKALMETESLWADIRTVSPELADEIEARLRKKKVYDFEAVREEWPEVKERILSDGAEASFDDITAGMGAQ